MSADSSAHISGKQKLDNVSFIPCTFVLFLMSRIAGFNWVTLLCCASLHLAVNFFHLIYLCFTVYSCLSGSTWDLRVICDVPDTQKVRLLYLVEVETFNLRVLCALSFLNPSHIPSLSVAPTMTHLAYIRIYLTPKNKKRIIWTTTNKTLSYSDVPCSCFPASGVSLMLPIWESI